MSTQEQNRDAKGQENVYADVYTVLLGGMIVSTALFAFGLIRAMMLHTYFPLTEEWVRSHYHWSVVVHGLAAMDPTTLMMVATILLILTPVARVIVSIYAFWVDHDHKYVAVTSIVLFIMVLTYALSKAGLQ
ncbi:MAG TPA: DUF1634 domain-containing protein [Terriglobales bacterium]|nr:DUF1634 domain-containing protein [Terriglobales bacterium]